MIKTLVILNLVIKDRLGTCVGIISQSIGGRKLCAPTVTDFVHNVGANCVRPKGTLSKRKSLNCPHPPAPPTSGGSGVGEGSRMSASLCDKFNLYGSDLSLCSLCSLCWEHLTFAISRNA